MKNNAEPNHQEHSEENRSPVRIFYRRFVRIVEYYVFLCFILITIFPLFEYPWIPTFIRIIYLTGFPLLLLVVLVSLVKEPLLKYLENRWGVNSETNRESEKRTTARRP